MIFRPIVASSSPRPSGWRLGAAVAAGCLIAAAGAAEPAGAGPARPNILLLFSDQHHADALGCAGHAVVKTPHLDALARQGTLFRRAYCQDAICTPSRTSLLTGLYPRTTGCLDNPDTPRNPERFPMLHQILRANGYLTGCFGKRHLNKGMNQDWDRSATTISQKLDPSDEDYQTWIKAQGQWEEYQRDFPGTMKDDLMCHLSALKEENRLDAYAAQRSIAFMRQAKQEGKPFFCWTSMHFPHQPYTPAPRWAAMYPVDQAVLPASVFQPIDQLPPMLQDWRRKDQPPWNLAAAGRDAALYRRYVAYYHALVTEVDHWGGTVLAELERLGMAKDTIVIYTSDHGDFVASHGMVEKCALGHNVYEDTLRVPLIVSWPGRFRQGQVRDDLVELVDLVPTVLQATATVRPTGPGIPPLAGRSLVPTLVEGNPVGRTHAFSENWSQVTVIGERYKLGVWVDPGAGRKQRNWSGGAVRDLLFDRSRDPGEVDNRCGDAAIQEVESGLRRALAAWLQATSDAGRRELVGQAKP